MVVATSVDGTVTTATAADPAAAGTVAAVTAVAAIAIRPATAGVLAVGHTGTCCL